MQKTALLIAASVVLAACSSQQDANKDNFKKSIERSTKNESVCLPLALEITNPDGSPARNVLIGESPILIADKDNNGKRINQTAADQMEALVDADMYQQTDKSSTKTAGKTIRTITYEVTEKGVQQIQTTTRGPIFCLGHMDVDKVNWFTEPTPANGMTVSQVSYQAKFVPEKWAKKLIKASKGKWANLDEPQEQTATLMKTNEGWRDVRELH